MCVSVLERRGIGRSHPEYEDRLAELIAAAWNLSREYNPERDNARRKGQERNLAAFVYYRLGHRVVDGERARYRTKWVTKNYTYERPRPVFVELEERELDESLGARAGDPATSGSPDLAGVLRGRRLGDARDVDLLRERPARRAA